MKIVSCNVNFPAREKRFSSDCRDRLHEKTFKHIDQSNTIRTFTLTNYFYGEVMFSLASSLPSSYLQDHLALLCNTRMCFFISLLSSRWTNETADVSPVAFYLDTGIHKLCLTITLLDQVSWGFIVSWGTTINAHPLNGTKEEKATVLHMIIDISLILPSSMCTIKSVSLHSKRKKRFCMCVWSWHRYCSEAFRHHDSHIQATHLYNGVPN